MKDYSIVPTGLPASAWYDADYRMEHAIVHLLIEFFEEEKPSEVTGWSSPECAELTQLYEYFRSLEHFPTTQDEILNPDKYNQFNKNLLRVVELRSYLWT